MRKKSRGKLPSSTRLSIAKAVGMDAVDALAVIGGRLDQSQRVPRVRDLVTVLGYEARAMRP
jgi:hypothetical protein